MYTVTVAMYSSVLEHYVSEWIVYTVRLLAQSKQLIFVHDK